MQKDGQLQRELLQCCGCGINSQPGDLAYWKVVAQRDGDARGGMRVEHRPAWYRFGLVRVAEDDGHNKLLEVATTWKYDGVSMKSERSGVSMGGVRGMRGETRHREKKGMSKLERGMREEGMGAVRRVRPSNGTRGEAGGGGEDPRDYRP